MLEEAEMRRAMEMSRAIQNKTMAENIGKEKLTLVESIGKEEFTSGKEEGEITLVQGEQHVVNTKPHVLWSQQDVMDISDDSEEEYLARPRVVLFINCKVTCTS